MVQTAQRVSFDEIKKIYPDEWVVLGDPVIEGVRVVSGVLLAHGKDKQKVALEGKNLVKGFTSTAFRYTGEFPRNRKFLL